LKGKKTSESIWLINKLILWLKGLETSSESLERNVPKDFADASFAEKFFLLISLQNSRLRLKVFFFFQIKIKIKT